MWSASLFVDLNFFPHFFTEESFKMVVDNLPIITNDPQKIVMG